MANPIHFFLPKEQKFFELLIRQGDTVWEASKIHANFMKKYSSLTEKQRKKMISEIDELEKKGDTQTEEIIELLNKSLITPYDREDIHALAISLDDQLDYIKKTGRRIELYKIKAIPKTMQEQSELLHKMVYAVHLAVKHLNKLNEVKKYCNEIYHLEHQGDHLFSKAIQELFEKSGKNDILNVIKFKDLYESIEKRFNKGKHLADVLQEIVVKHS